VALVGVAAESYWHERDQAHPDHSGGRGSRGQATQTASSHVLVLQISVEPGWTGLSTIWCLNTPRQYMVCSKHNWKVRGQPNRSDDHGIGTQVRPA
jgi:hypothetical protein